MKFRAGGKTKNNDIPGQVMRLQVRFSKMPELSLSFEVLSRIPGPGQSQQLTPRLLKLVTTISTWRSSGVQIGPAV